MTQERFSSYYAAKFERESRRVPQDWIVIPTGSGWFELKRIGFKERK